ncbi:MAG: hypothetical protein HQL12_03240 [Candidatus Omnitrophica bacterium]|nr:hypothetical protein [Candidatus Omnitrophota bacterium]
MFPSVLCEFFLLVFLPFIVWVTAWWGHISGKYGLMGDAFNYYWDSRFFLDNISHGIYPLWNPDYSGGVVWNFFLRRMGEFNPFYWIISGLKVFGLGAIEAHLVFLVLYYFLGLVGFWLLARLFLKDRLTSTGAYLLLLFCWGGQLFYCFDVLQFVPLVWFFYFLFVFALEAKKHSFLGVCFTLALIVTTYVPFFPLTVIGSFLFFVFLFYMKESLCFFGTAKNFMRAHKFFTVMSLGFLLLACSLPVNFYFESRGGGFVLPNRHLGATDKSEVALTTNVSNNEKGITYANKVWDIIAYGNFDKVFSNQKDMTISNFNIAYLFFIVPLLAIINPVSRRSALLLVSWVFLILINITNGRLYLFVLEHVFFYRYMRMLQLFLWLAVVPMAILMVMEQMRVFMRNHEGRKDIKVMLYVIAVHVLFFAGLLTQQGASWSSCLSVAMSLVFFILAIMGYRARGAMAVMLWFSLMIQPITFAYYIDRNCLGCSPSLLHDHASFYQTHFLLPQRTSVMPGGGVNTSIADQRGDLDYYANPWVSGLQQNIGQVNYRQFIFNKLLLFDNTIPEDHFSPDKFSSKLSTLLSSRKNCVLLPQAASLPEDFRSLAPRVLKAQAVYDDTPEVKVLLFDANTLQLQTSLDHPRFLLWTNGYHPGWKVTIDGHENRLLRADCAFKGVWVPQGIHKIIFRFGTPLQYAADYILLIGFIVTVIMVLILGIKEGFMVEKGTGIEN